MADSPADSDPPVPPTPRQEVAARDIHKAASARVNDWMNKALARGATIADVRAREQFPPGTATVLCIQFVAKKLRDHSSDSGTAKFRNGFIEAGRIQRAIEESRSADECVEFMPIHGQFPAFKVPISTLARFAMSFDIHNVSDPLRQPILANLAVARQRDTGHTVALVVGEKTEPADPADPEQSAEGEPERSAHAE